MAANEAITRSTADARRRTRATDPVRPSLAGAPARRRLTAQEREVALLVGDGLSDQAIAHRLALATTTVATYVRRIRDRLKLAGRQDLVAWVNARRDPAHPEASIRRVEPSQPARIIRA